MDDLKTFMGRAWASLVEGWRKLLVTSRGTRTHFGQESTRKDSGGQEFPQWSLLAAEIWETAQSVVVRVEIPGMSRNDFTIYIERGELKIKGEKRSGADDHGGLYHLSQRAYGPFVRSIPLPRSVIAEKPEISYRDGVLAVILPKAEATPPVAGGFKLNR